MARTQTRLAVVFVDYLKFIRASDRYKGQRHYEVGEISAGLKQFAKDEGLCVVLLAQLNRALESREDKLPDVSRTCGNPGIWRPTPMSSCSCTARRIAY